MLLLLDCISSTEGKSTVVCYEFFDILEDFCIAFSDERFLSPGFLCCRGEFASQHEWHYEEAFNPFDKFISSM